MNKQTRIVFFVLIALVGLLAASTSFFYAKTRKLGAPKSASTPKTSPSIGAIATDKDTTPKPTISTQVTRASTSTEKPSKPTDTVTVQRGETLFAVATANGTTWTELAEVNGIDDVNKIQAGQVLIVPKVGIVNYTIDNTKATDLQKAVDSGKYSFRLSPDETARADAPSVFGLQITDDFSLKEREVNAGTATVQAVRESKKYLIKLIQPVTKGEKGIWAIESIQAA